jgi:tRNA(fMet)-specific endonuclease VapC
MMPDRIIDTNILLAYARGRELYNKIEAHFALRKSGLGTLVSIVSEGELRVLALQFVWGEARQQEMERQLAYCTIVPLPFSDIVQVYAEIDDYSRRKGVTMGKNEIWIAATAAVTWVRLLTTDRDFDHLDGVYLTRDWVDPAL